MANIKIFAFPCCDSYYMNDEEILRIFEGGEYKIMSNGKKAQEEINKILSAKNLTADYRLSPRSFCAEKDMQERGLIYDPVNGKYEQITK